MPNSKRGGVGNERGNEALRALPLEMIQLLFLEGNDQIVMIGFEGGAGRGVRSHFARSAAQDL